MLPFLLTPLAFSFAALVIEKAMTLPVYFTRKVMGLRLDTIEGRPRFWNAPEGSDPF